jgi:predicted Zn-ribbon and HTH transcriptional regulator
MIAKRDMPIPPEMICDCLRCGHAWVKRVAGRPVRCPKCKQPNWDVAAGVLPMGRPPKAKKGRKK